MTEESHSIDTATGAEAPAELSQERVRRIFGAIARQYRRFNAFSSFGLYRSWMRRTVDAAGLTPASRMIDLAGGTGDISFAAARRNPPAHIQLTDYTAEMLEVAQERFEAGESMGVPMDFEVVDAQDIPYSDESFDAATMAYGIRNMPDRKRALSEMLRVLKPGGTLVCLEFSTPPNPVWRSLYGFYLKHLIPFWGGLITGDRKGFVYLSQSIKAVPRQEALARMFEEVGFEHVEWTNCTGGIAAVHAARKPRF